MKKNHIPHLADKSVTKLFGILPDGKEVYKYTLANGKGLEVSFINYGAAITSLIVKDIDGAKTDVVLGFDDLESYIDSYNLPSPPLFWLRS